MVPANPAHLAVVVPLMSLSLLRAEALLAPGLEPMRTCASSWELSPWFEETARAALQ
jgi:hypothetical protein